MISSEKRILNKVPEVTAIFWAIKVLSTTVGETFADFINTNLGLGLIKTSVLFSIVLIAILLLQMRQNRYIPALYWVVVVLMSITGTLITDFLGDQLNISLEITSIIFGILLIATLATWYLREKTLSIKEVDTRSRETYYWLAILFTFSLGTSGGDMVAEKFALGYGVAWLIFAGIILVVALLRRLDVLGSVSSFWLAYIMTRPLGAASGDYLSQAKSDGGIGLGTGSTSSIFLIAIIALVGLLTWQDRRRTL